MTMVKLTKNHVSKIFAPKEETFYSTLRPLALFAKALGMFPLQNVFTSDGRHLTYKFLSLTTLWGPVLHYTINFMYYIFETSDWWKFLFPYVNLPRAILVTITTLIGDQLLSKLIASLEEFDLKYRKISRKRIENRSRKYIGTVWMVISMASLFFYVFSEMSAHPKNRLISYAIAVTNQVNVVPRMLFLNMFMFFCQSLVWRFEDVRTLWRDTVRGVASEQWWDKRDGMAGRLEEVRLLHHQLFTIVQDLNSCYGLRLAVYFAIFLTEILQDLYVVLYMVNSAPNINQMLFTAYNVTVLLGVTHFAGKLADSMLVAVTTYLIVLIQFDTQLRELTSGYTL